MSNNKNINEMKYSKEEINEFRKQQLIKDIESSNNATLVTSREGKINDFKIHLSRVEEMMIEGKK